MTTNIHLGFTGNCDAAFAFYEQVFGARREMTMTWGEAPPGGMTIPPAAEKLVMHTALRVGSLTLMGADALPGQGRPFGGFDISLDDPDEATVRKLFESLSQGGQVTMPLQPTFWTPLFGMCTDRFGVPWMISVTGPSA